MGQHLASGDSLIGILKYLFNNNIVTSGLTFSQLILTWKWANIIIIHCLFSILVEEVILFDPD